MSAARIPTQRRAMGPLRLILVLVLVLVILAFEYDWLTKPWWQKTLRYCGSLRLSRLVDDLVGWLGW